MNFGRTHWVLNERGIAIVEPDPHKWSRWMIENHDAQRRVALSEVHHCTVSTIFLGIDHNFMSLGEPVLFETMVFQGERESMDCGQPIDFEGSDSSDPIATALWGNLRRYSFLSEALEGHKQAVLSIEKQFGEVRDKVNGLIYGIMNMEEWVKDEH